MKTPLKSFTFLLSIIIVTALACQFDPMEEKPILPSAKSELSRVNVDPSSGSKYFLVTVSYSWRYGDSDFAISCTYPNPDGNYISAAIPLTHSVRTSEFSFTIEKPGTYNISCQDSNSNNAATVFTVEKPAPAADEPPAPASGSFKIPKPGYFSSAGMWMYFAKGTSDLEGYPVPQQCLPGVNYTHAGGTSSFDIDTAGNVTGSCSLTYYNNTTMLSGKMSGTWDSATDQISFKLETVTVSDVVINGKSGTTRNETVFTGTATFNSAIQASGTATWHTECQSNNVDVAVCYNREHATNLIANGTVPFVINFNEK